ncbi:hypothetical protein [Arthrobacter sp. HY1533]|uniref:hypothetical protein n=1 Tax=Arthrobacter sp. HY1533 TaxID=2970919 RepID=UPI0022B9EEA4|nr:hypothetical protein [Arthrobacter sp. HY1533]
MAATAIVASIALGALLAGPASAEPNKNELLQLSSDGVNFATDAIPTMFRSTKGYVPGESRRALIWVRNASKHPAHLSVAVRNTGMATSSVLPKHLFFKAQSQNRSPAATSLPASGTCTPLIDDWTLAGGAVLPLTVDLGLLVDAPNSTRKQSAEFALTFLMQEQGPGKLVNACAGTTDSPPAGEGVASVVVGGGTSVTTNGGGALNSNGAVAGDDEATANPSLAPDPSGAEPLPEARPLLPQLQSNVEATSYNPWAWIVLASGCVYMFAISRKRSTTR